MRQTLRNIWQQKIWSCQVRSRSYDVIRGTTSGNFSNKVVFSRNLTWQMTWQIDANDNIWTWLGQDVARLEFAHCRLGHRGHLRSVTSVDLTFTSNHEFRASNRFARWWIRIAWFFSHLCYHDGYSNPYCVDEFHDSFHWKAACGADSVNIVIKRH